MREIRFKTKCVSHAGSFLAVILLLQPLLDVLSFFMQEAGTTAVTTVIRLILLAVVSLYGFVISDRRQLYAAGWAVVAGFWLLHSLNSIREGYLEPIGDAAEFLKLVQFPLWAMAFFTIFQKREGESEDVFGVLAINFGVILLVIGLSYLTGHTAFTYDFPERGIQLGVLGWFGVPNAQSAILSLLVPGVILWALNTEQFWVYTVCSAAGLGLLYMTGTRLTYYTALLCAAGFLLLILLCRRPPVFCLPMLAFFILLLALRGVSPMEQRQQVSETSFAVYQEKIDAVMGEDRDFTYTQGQEIPPAVYEKIKTLYTDVYGVEGVYGEVLLGDLNERFGVEKVMEEFSYSIRPQVLNNSRTRKLIALRMVWEERDFLTHLVGMEYSAAKIGAHNYDPENDFPALLYFTGYLGVAIYGLFLLGIVLYAILAFFVRFPSLLSPEFGTAAMMCALALGAAQLSGQVLRRPNVTVYFSLAAALLLVLARETPSPRKLTTIYKPNPAVTRMKIG